MCVICELQLLEFFFFLCNMSKAKPPFKMLPLKIKPFAAKGSLNDFWWQAEKWMHLPPWFSFFYFVHKNPFSRRAHCLTGLEIGPGHINASLITIWSIFLPSFLWHPSEEIFHATIRGITNDSLCTTEGCVIIDSMHWPLSTAVDLTRVPKYMALSSF